MICVHITTFNEAQAKETVRAIKCCVEYAIECEIRHDFVVGKGVSGGFHLLSKEAPVPTFNGFNTCRPSNAAELFVLSNGC